MPPNPPLVWAIPFSSSERVAHLVGSPDPEGLAERACMPGHLINRGLAEVTLTPKGGLCKTCSRILVTLTRQEITGHD